RFHSRSNVSACSRESRRIFKSRTRFARSASTASAFPGEPVSRTARSYSGPKWLRSLMRRWRCAYIHATAAIARTTTAAITSHIVCESTTTSRFHGNGRNDCSVYWLELSVTNLKSDLDALRIEREPERRGLGRWIVWTGLIIVLAALGFGGWRWITRERPIEVQATTVTMRPAGTQAAVLNASG